MAGNITAPSNLGKSGNPFVKFRSEGGDFDGYVVNLYVPTGITVSDGTSYANFDAGMIAPAKAIFDAGRNRGDQDLKDAIETEIRNQLPKNADDKAVAISLLLAKAGATPQLLGKTANEGAIGRLALNPNTVLQYQNAAIRQFQMQFKLIAENPSDSELFREVIKTFRLSMYPEGNGDLLLKYPAKWNVTFYTETGNINPYMPKIAPCYITNLSQVNNPQGNIFRKDGSPNEIEFSMTLQETRVLERNRLRELEG